MAGEARPLSASKARLYTASKARPHHTASEARPSTRRARLAICTTRPLFSTLPPSKCTHSSDAQQTYVLIAMPGLILEHAANLRYESGMPYGTPFAFSFFVFKA
eukprot:3650829-Pleurochrysis_carterae.AAC.4